MLMLASLEDRSVGMIYFDILYISMIHFVVLMLSLEPSSIIDQTKCTTYCGVLKIAIHCNISAFSNSCQQRVYVTWEIPRLILILMVNCINLRFSELGT